jgi:hypothetical protein
LPIFGKKIGVFLKNQYYEKFLKEKLAGANPTIFEFTATTPARVF